MNAALTLGCFPCCSMLEMACHDTQYGVQECALMALRSMCSQPSLKKVSVTPTDNLYICVCVCVDICVCDCVCDCVCEWCVCVCVCGLCVCGVCERVCGVYVWCG